MRTDPYRDEATISVVVVDGERWLQIASQGRDKYDRERMLIRVSDVVAALKAKAPAG